jgi:ankyrin repeat domain-containing protein 50
MKKLNVLLLCLGLVSVGVLQAYTAGSPLMYAAAAGDVNKINALLNTKGTDVNAVNFKGWTALMVAGFYGQVDAVNALLKVPGIDVNAANTIPHSPNREKNTALMVASAHGNISGVQALVKGGANINIVGLNGNTALKLAQENNHPQVAAYLKSIAAK